MSTTGTEIASNRTADRHFLWALMLITAAGVAVRLYVGSREFMDFDEWQQLFMASVPRWVDLKYELKTEAHPPLFFLVLKALLAFGSGKLWYRSIAIVPGAGSIILIGLIGRKLFRFSGIALLCAGALALSTAAITISIEVRQYQLTIFFILIAFHAYLEMLCAVPVRFRDFAIFSLASTLAVSCHYSAALYLAPCILIPFLFRSSLGPPWKMFTGMVNQRRLWLAALSLAIPSGVFAFFYFKYARRFNLEGHPGFEFYWPWSVNETLAAFLLRNSQNFANLFSPVHIQNRAAFLVFVAVLGMASTLVFLKSRREKMAPHGIPIAFTGIIVLELMILSIAGKYPFGGLLRHQYIAGPFVILSAFAVLDALVSLAVPRLRLALLTLFGLGIATNLVAAWNTIMIYPDIPKLYSLEFDHYQSTFPRAKAVYVDHWGVIGYFINTDERKRHFVRGISGTAFIDQYHMDGPGAGVDIFYDKSRYNIDLTDTALYSSFAECLKQSGVNELTLFFFTPGAVPLREPDSLKRTIMKRASDQGLSATKIVIDDTAAYAGFVLK